MAVAPQYQADVEAILALIAAPLVLARAFRRDESWRDLRAYSIISGSSALGC